MLVGPGFKTCITAYKKTKDGPENIVATIDHGRRGTISFPPCLLFEQAGGASFRGVYAIRKSWCVVSHI
jgi:hypothetical protein